jgi:hypothetical protein
MTIEDIKTQIEGALATEEVKSKGIWAKYWPYIAGAVGLLACGFIVGKIL